MDRRPLRIPGACGRFSRKKKKLLRKTKATPRKTTGPSTDSSTNSDEYTKTQQQQRSIPRAELTPVSLVPRAKSSPSSSPQNGNRISSGVTRRKKYTRKKKLIKPKNKKTSQEDPPQEQEDPGQGPSGRKPETVSQNKSPKTNNSIMSPRESCPQLPKLPPKANGSSNKTGFSSAVGSSRINRSQMRHGPHVDPVPARITDSLVPVMMVQESPVMIGHMTPVMRMADYSTMMTGAFGPAMIISRAPRMSRSLSPRLSGSSSGRSARSLSPKKKDSVSSRSKLEECIKKRTELAKNTVDALPLHGTVASTLSGIEASSNFGLEMPSLPRMEVSPLLPQTDCSVYSTLGDNKLLKSEGLVGSKLEKCRKEREELAKNTVDALSLHGMVAPSLSVIKSISCFGMETPSSPRMEISFLSPQKEGPVSSRLGDDKLLKSEELVGSKLEECKKKREELAKDTVDLLSMHGTEASSMSGIDVSSCFGMETPSLPRMEESSLPGTDALSLIGMSAPSLTGTDAAPIYDARTPFVPRTGMPSLNGTDVSSLPRMGESSLFGMRTPFLPRMDAPSSSGMDAASLPRMGESSLFGTRTPFLPRMEEAALPRQELPMLPRTGESTPPRVSGSSPVRINEPPLRKFNECPSRSRSPNMQLSMANRRSGSLPPTINRSSPERTLFASSSIASNTISLPIYERTPPDQIRRRSPLLHELYFQGTDYRDVSSDTIVRIDNNEGYVIWASLNPHDVDMNKLEYKDFRAITHTLHLDEYLRVMESERLIAKPIGEYFPSGSSELCRMEGIWLRPTKEGHNAYGNVSLEVPFTKFMQKFLLSYPYRVYPLEVFQSETECISRYLIANSSDPSIPRHWTKYDYLRPGGGWFTDNDLVFRRILHRIPKFIRNFKSLGLHPANHEIEFFFKLDDNTNRMLYSLLKAVPVDHQLANSIGDNKCRKYRSGRPSNWSMCPYALTALESDTQIS